LQYKDHQQFFSMVSADHSSAAITFAAVSYATPSGHSLLNALDFTVAAGEILVLLGRSGSGKTTTLRLVNRLLDPTAGQVIVNGRSTHQWDPVALRRSIGYVIQEVGLFPHRTVEQNIATVPRLEHWEDSRVKARVGELLQLVRLPQNGFRARYPHQLSGGQRQRVGLARALAPDPHILLMDEPFGAIDPITRAELQQEFRQLQSQLNKTVLFVTHDVLEALALGTRIGVMESGQLTGIFRPDEFVKSTRPDVRAYMEIVRASQDALRRMEQ